MVRQTKAEVDAQILDQAAALFSRFGIKHTSVQAIADAVGYSKAGLLHRFPSKEAIEDAVFDSGTTRIETLVESLTDQLNGVERDRLAIEALVDMSHQYPGYTSLMLSAISHPDEQFSERMDPFASALFHLFGEDFDCGNGERLLRIGAACGALLVLTLGINHKQHNANIADVNQHIVSACMNTLGHFDSSTNG